MHATNNAASLNHNGQVYKQFARQAEQEGLLALQTEEELLYEMLGVDSPPPLGQVQIGQQRQHI